MANLLKLVVEPNTEGVDAITPIVDGCRLPELVGKFEQDTGYNDPSGGYAGIIPSFFNYGPLDKYYRGESEGYFSSGTVAVLGCECGEMGCWPLYCQVSVDHDRVTWSDFQQPHRPKRNYSGFGPFSFDRQQYEEELAKLPQF